MFEKINNQHRKAASDSHVRELIKPYSYLQSQCKQMPVTIYYSPFYAKIVYLVGPLINRPH